MATYPVRTRRWTRAEYERLIDIGVYRRRVSDPSSPFGWHYASKEVLRAESFVELLAAPGARILVSDLLP